MCREIITRHFTGYSKSAGNNICRPGDIPLNVMKQLRRPFQTSLAALAWTAIFIGTFLIACEDDDDDVPGREGTTFVDNLDTPWELAFAPDGRLFFTERPGTITVVENGEKKA